MQAKTFNPPPPPPQAGGGACHESLQTIGPQTQ